MLRGVLKLIMAVIFVAVLFCIGLGAYCLTSGKTPWQVFGVSNEDAAEFAAVEGLGIDKETYEEVESAAKELGITAEEAKEAQKEIESDSDAAAKAKDLYEQYKDGDLSADQALEEFEAYLGKE